MLTTKNELGAKWGFGILSPARFFAFLALAAALAGCSPAGSHALLKGKKLLDQGDYADAADEFKSATEDMTTNAVAWDYLGVAEQHAGQFEEAAAAYQRALDLDRDLTEAHYNLGCLWLEQNKPDEAVSEFTAYTLRRPNTPEGWLKLGLAQLRARDILSAEKSFSTANYLSPNNAEALNGLGLARMQRNRPEDAEKFFKAAVQNHPGFGPAILNLATVEHEYLHNDRLALDEYRAYLALNPRPANWDEVQAMTNSLAPAPTTPAPPAQIQNPPRENLAYNEQRPQEPRQPERRPPPERQTETQPSRQTYIPPREQTQTVQVQPESPIVTTPSQPNAPASTGLQPVREPDEFASVQTPPPENKPEHNYNPFHWFRQAPTQQDLRVTPLPREDASVSAPPRPVHIVQPAPPAFPHYLYLSPRKPEAGDRRAASAMFSRARQYEMQNRFTDALDSYRRAARLDPSWFEAQYNCGVMAFRLRDYQLSLNAYEMALAIEPDSPSARYNFALALKAAGYVPDAVTQLKKILAANPDDVRSHLELGNIYAQQLLDVPRARQEYQRVLQLDPGNPQAPNIQFWLSANPQ